MSDLRALILLVASAFVVSAITPAFANDSTAELKTGGLVLTRTPDVEMRSEELFISTEAINVRYHFVNRSAADVATLVAFPMPDLHDNGDGSEVAIPVTSDNFLGFETAVDGMPVAATLDQRATVMGVDYSSLLRELHVPLMPFSEATTHALDRVPASRRQELLDDRLVELDDSQPEQQHLSPRWTLESAYVWRQVFPAGREITVEHRYKPSVGRFVSTMLGNPGYDNTAEIRRYCVEPSFSHKVSKAKRDSGLPDGPFSEATISYVLKTGANWAAPINDFRLVVDKGSAKNLVSFCGDGVQKISPTQFEMRKRDFVPDANLDVLILEAGSR